MSKGITSFWVGSLYMASSMVNSGSFGSERNENSKVTCMQTNSLHNNTSSPLTASSATQSSCKNDLMEAVDNGQLYKAHAVEPTPSETKCNEFKSDRYDNNLRHLESSANPNKPETNETKRSLFCSLPLEKVQTILSKYTSFRSDGTKMKAPRKVLCLYCDRTFVNVNLLQKHVERCHSSKQLRRVSLRKHQNFLTSTPCIYCDKFTTTEHTLKELFKHLIQNHSNKYYGCLCCELRFLNSSHLADHNALCHNIITAPQDTTSDSQNSVSFNSEKQEPQQLCVKTPRKKLRTRKEGKSLDVNTTNTGSNEESSKTGNIKNLRSKKLAVKSSRMILKRSKRIQAKVTDPPKKKRAREFNEKKKKHDRIEQNFGTKGNEKSTKASSNFVNPYPEFDHFFQVKKITDHSIDNLKISSLTFDDVFDKAFFTRIKCNIQENLLHHIDGKLFKNEESENRISNFEKISSVPQETQNLHSENYGCEISLNAIAPTTLLLSNQLGDDPESQIEYGSKPSKKKTQLKKDEIHYKYFTRRKYQASILEHKENRDLSKLDMWTQYVIKNRQQKIVDDKKSPKEILDYFAGEEYKNMMKREELNRILDRRGPFEDLKEEVSKKAALDKLNRENSTNYDHSTEIGELLDDILNRVFELVKEPSMPPFAKNTNQYNEENIPEIPSYLNLRSSKSVIPENEIDRSDKIALICSSQETENFELPSNTVRGKNEKVELTGEWARSRIYVCAACGLKLQNIKQFLEHKSASHQYIWVQHYEFVGNQSELYRHLSIPTLGKVGVLENTAQCKLWKRSDARLCTKCGKQCNSLGELHRHILECGGDWTWMLARKKCKYRPFGAKSRRKRRGLVKRIYTQKTEPSEKKVYKKSYDKPSDAETIKRMLANLPPKRATRKIMSLKDGFHTSRTRQVKTTKQPKFKCGKLIRGKTKEQSTVSKTEYEKPNKTQTNSYRRSLRCLNKVLTSRILDTNTSLIVRRKYTRKINKEKNQNRDLHSDKSHSDGSMQVREENLSKGSPKKVTKGNTVKEKVQVEDQTKEELNKTKRCSPRIEKRSEFSVNVDKMNIKRFFPVKKKKRINNTDSPKNVYTNKVDSCNKDVEEGEPEQKKLETAEEKGDDSQSDNSLNLRKRKNDKSLASTKIKKSKMRNTSATIKTRQLRKNLRSVTSEENSPISVPEPLKDCEEEKQNEVDFFEKQASDPTNENTAELDIKPAIEEQEHIVNVPEVEKETQDKDNKHINEFDSSTALLSKSENQNACSLVSPTGRTIQPKRKVKKPARGLNDCIAMLTSKLGRNFENSTTHNVFSEESSGQMSSENVQIEGCQRPEYILKVPLSNEHFHLRSQNDDECLDLSSNFKQNLNCKLNFGSEKFRPNDFFPQNEVPVSSIDCNEFIENTTKLFEVDKSNEDQDLTLVSQLTKEAEDDILADVGSAGQTSTASLSEDEEELSEELAESSVHLNEELMYLDKSTDKINDEIPGELESNILSQHSHDTDSEDEIPLSNLLRDEDRSLSGTRNSSIDEQMNDLSINLLAPLNNDEEMSTDLLHKEESNIQMNNNSFNDKDFEDDNTASEKVKLNPCDGDAKLSKKKDVLMEINDNCHENTEHQNSINLSIFEPNSNKLDHINKKVLETKLEDQLLVTSNLSLPYKDCSKLDSTNEAKDVDNSSSLDTHCENQALPMLNKFNFFTQNNVDDIVWKNAVSDIINDEPIMSVEPNQDEDKKNTDTSDYKENSLLVEEPVAKHKQKKKSNKSSNKNKTETQSKHTVKEVAELEKLVIRKPSRSAKTKALGSILDEVLLELSENEQPIENVKDATDESVTKDCDQTPIETDNLLEKEIDSEGLVTNIDDRENSVSGGGSFIPPIEAQTVSSQEEAYNEKPAPNENKTNMDSGKELRRSSRNSKRVTCYNETDLLDPLLDDLESDRTISKIIKETTKDIFGVKRKHRKLSSHKKLKNGQNEKKVNGDELFDLLKSTTNENIVLSKPTNTFFNTFDEISNEFNDDNFDVLEDILEKSIAVIEENLSEQTALISSEVVANNFDQVTGQDSKSSSCQEAKKPTKKKSKKHKNKNSVINSQLNNKLISFEKTSKDPQSVIDDNDAEYLLNVESVDNDVSSNEINQVDAKVNERNKSKDIYCDICNKSFCRMESLTKHKRTLTHISKLSELEAKEAAMKTKCAELNESEETETTRMSVNSTKELNLLDMLGNMDDTDCKQFSSPFTVNVNNSNLKLADIINDVLNKPMLKKDGGTQSFEEIIMHNENETQPETRRCKSLAERKSFESENCLVTQNNPHVKNVDFLESDISNAAAGTILEKQITLLENIIENRSSLDFMEELSVSSSVNENVELENEIDVTESKQIEAVYSDSLHKKNSPKINVDNDFLKPSQYEEISEDSNLRNYDEQKSRKVLNRDEELFLECCSLLKSGSEVSSYSKKSNNLSKDLNNVELKHSDEPDWLESNCVSQKENCEFVECYSDSSRIRTPLGDNFSQEESNSATISSQWEVNNRTSSKNSDWKEDLTLKSQNLTFEKVFSSGKSEEMFCERNEIEELHTVVSSFDRVISEVLHTELDTSSENIKKDSVIDLEELSTASNENEDYKDSGVIDGKKMLTKGAMKVFEGLKVSIPTEELNIDKILISGPVKIQSDSDVTEVSFKSAKSNKRNSQSQSKPGKLGKTKHISKSVNLKKLDMQMNSKDHDVYDFEETQDNSDVFTKPDFRSFRHNNEKSRKSEKLEGSDDDSRDYTDTLSLDALSSSTSSVSEVLPTRSETEQNITKKKCMIMGRIFKNAVKSRSTDEEIRSIPAIDNTKLVENFVLSCPEPLATAADKKPRMTEEEMNLAFDKLINSKPHETKDASPKTCTLQPQPKTGLTKRKQKIKNKKRSHGHSESSDDEFDLQKFSKKRHKKKNNNTEESCINLEQELKECIGVASRKSQRKCTSGKQNVLIEYWSSDESSFETLLEKQIVESAKKNHSRNNGSKNIPVQEPHCKETKITVENVPNYDNLNQVVEAEITHKKTKMSAPTSSVNRRKRVAANPLYHWSSSSEDESRDLIEVRPVRDEIEDDEDRPVQHGWIVGDSPKKLVTMLAQAKGKKCDVDSVKEHGKKRTSTFS